MSEIQLLLLSPDGKTARVNLSSHVPISLLDVPIAQALGLAAETSLVLRRDNGTTLDPGESFDRIGIRAGAKVLVEPKRKAAAGILGRLNRERLEPDTDAIPSGYRVLPCYLVVDTSLSMSGQPIAQINEELPRLCRSMLREPVLAEICQLSLVTFDETARVDVALTDVMRMNVPQIRAKGRVTDYTKPFDLLRATIAVDLYKLYRTGRRPYQPAVFFLSDGQHNQVSDWSAALRSLSDRHSFYGAPHMIAFGFGEATEDNIRTIGSRAAYMPEEGSPSAKLDTFMAFLLNSLTNSVTAVPHDSDDVLVVPESAPTGWRALRIRS